MTRLRTKFAAKCKCDNWTRIERILIILKDVSKTHLNGWMEKICFLKIDPK